MGRTFEGTRLIREEIRAMMRARYTAHDIMKRLRAKNISRARVRSHLAAIRAEDERWMEVLAKFAFTTAYRCSIESMEEEVQYLKVARSQATRVCDKVQIALAIKEFEMGLIQLLADAPIVWSANRPKNSK
jgi:hypothetical protein